MIGNAIETGSDFMDGRREMPRLTADDYFLPAAFDRESTVRVDVLQAAWMTEFIVGNAERRLRHPIRINILRTPDDAFVVWAPVISSSGSGWTLRDALKDFSSSAIHLYYSLVEANDAELAEDALILKRRLAALIR